MPEKAGTKINVHYSGLPDLELSLKPQVHVDIKPQGLWLSHDEEDGWLEWCRREDFSSERFAYRFIVEVTDDERRICWLRTEAQMEWFNNRYQAAGSGILPVIDWELVARDWHGLMIPRYFWCFRLESALSHWYYGWDCASGCIWNPEAIASVTKDETWVKPDPFYIGYGEGEDD